jgi:hypothetical protein
VIGFSVSDIIWPLNNKARRQGDAQMAPRPGIASA